MVLSRVRRAQARLHPLRGLKLGAAHVAVLGDLFDPLPELRADVITAVVPYVPSPELGLLHRDTLAFEAIPDTWFCPVCGARKRDFEPYED